MQSWIALLPPMLVILAAIYTKKVTTALTAGIVSAALIASNYKIFSAIKLIITRMAQEANLDILLYKTDESPDHIYTFAFLILLGIIIGLITHTGGLTAYSNWLKKKLNSAKQTQTIALMLSSLFFLDDYLNCLTVGAIMKPLTDSFRIPRVKLAYILNSLSGPLCVLIPATSWVATVITQLQVAGVSTEQTNSISVMADPFFTYLSSMPYFIYPISVVVSTLFIVRKQISFGPMYKQESIAQETGNLFGNKEPLHISTHIQENSNNKIIDFFFPIISFIVIVLATIFYLGSWTVFGGHNNFIQMLQSINMLKVLFYASLLTVILSLIFAHVRKSLHLNKILCLTKESWDLMKISILVLFLAWTFSSLLKNDLETGTYIANNLLTKLPFIFIPLMVFLTTLIVAGSTGSSWGAITVIVPLAIPLALKNVETLPVLLNQAPALLPIIGALISGAVAGGHISSISDATVIASTSTSSYLIDHYITQLPYILPVIISTCIGFIVVGFTNIATLGLGLAIFLSLSTLWALNIILNKKKSV